MTNPSCVGGQGLREIVIDHRPRFIKPLLPVFRRTVRDHAKHDSVKNAHSAKIKYTILPDTFQRIAEDVFFPLLWRIGCIEDQRGFGFQEADVGIKWTNDLVIGKRKVCGILTELAAEADSGMLEYAVVGIGVNCNTDTAALPEPARDVAVSLREAVGTAVDPNALAAAMVRRLHELDVQLPGALPQWLAEYAGVCVTLGQDVQILRAGETRLAHAIGIDEAGGLIVRYPDGTEGVVSSGEVSVRGMYGYV